MIDAILLLAVLALSIAFAYVAQTPNGRTMSSGA